MNNTSKTEDGITRAFVNIIKFEVHAKYPDFHFEHGSILYDDSFEAYVYSGFSKREMNILKQAEKNLYHN